MVHLVDPRTDTVLCRLFPQDKAENADRIRRKRAPGPCGEAVADEPERAASDIAPLLLRLMAEYAATGLPPAYIPKIDCTVSDEEEEES